MFNYFSSLENITTLLNNLVGSNQNALPLKYIGKLVNDFTNLLKESDSYSYDMEIKTGGADKEGVKTFKVHSIILKARSSYFKAALSNNWMIKKSQDGIILFEKENIFPNVFEILLM